MKQKFRKVFYVCSMLITAMFLMFWGNKITARADYDGTPTIEVIDGSKLRISLTSDTIHETYTVGKGTVDVNYAEYGWIVVFTDGSNEFDVAVQSWQMSDMTTQERNISDMQHSLWYSGRNIKNMDISLLGNTIIWEFSIPSESEVTANADVVIPVFDYSNPYITKYIIQMDGEVSSHDVTVNASHVSSIDQYRYITEYVDPGYELTETVPTVNVDQPEKSYELVSQGEFSEFKDLYLDGNKLTRDVDYTAVAGSTRITIQAQTLALNPLQFGQQHSLMLEFRTADTGELRTASQLFTVTNNEIEAQKQAATETVSQETTIASPVIKAVSNVIYGTLLEDGTYLVGKGDNLSRIAREYLESEKKWTEIYRLNSDIITDPNLIYKGQILKLQ